MQAEGEGMACIADILLADGDDLVHITLQWRHNERDGVSNHRYLDCFLNRLLAAYQRKHQSSASLDFVRGIQRWPVDSLHKMFPFEDVIMCVYDMDNYLHKTMECNSWSMPYFRRTI